MGDASLRAMAAEAVLLELGKSLAFSLSAFITRRVLKTADKRCNLDDSPLMIRVKTLLEQDLDKISAQISSLAQSKRYATKSYLENGILYLKKALAELEGDIKVQDNIMVPAEFLRKLPTSNEGLKRAMEWFREAHKSATEVFGDKKNIPPLQRLEAMEVILFCQTLEHWEDPKLTAEAWTTSVRHIYEDPELITAIKANLKKETLLQYSSSLSPPADMDWSRPNESMRSSFGKLAAMFTQLEAYVAQKEIPISVRHLLLAQIQRPDSLKNKYHFFHQPQGGAHSILSQLGFVIKVFSGGYGSLCALPNARLALLRDTEEGPVLETRDAVSARGIGAMKLDTAVLDIMAVGSTIFLLRANGSVEMTNAEGPRLSDSILAHVVDVLPSHTLALGSKDYTRLVPVDQETFLAADRAPFRGLAMFSRNANNPEPVVFRTSGLRAELGGELVLLGCRWGGGSSVVLVLLVARARVEVVSVNAGGEVLERNGVSLAGSDLGKADAVDWAWEEGGGLVLLGLMRGSESDFLLTTLDKGLTRILSEERLTSEEKDLTSIAFASNGVLCFADANQP